MFKDHANIINAISTAGEISGRKKLQKIVYIAKKLSFPFHEKFQFHFYGPYSEELTLRVEELCEMGYLNEVREKKAGYYQYCYSITDAGQDFLSIQEVEMPALEACLQDMNEQNARFLELVSTVLYFDTLEKEEVTEKIFTLKSKQKYTLEEIDEAYEYIEQLKTKAKPN
ncbi:YwgA family protein [Peribacillus simplex]|uniref:YwgA family protein n=1 Tax=Peribacillus TaxID=2675229 RepID=UPI0024C19A95|nr:MULTISPECIES: YwgA family protein [Peribacillus]MED3983331.1 YwgA family protein [Peribacillus simplex]MED4092431.1 YwgA family protein [Peribacillus simplex]WHX67003.1 YwgA family protein [Peribacillus frigoritolerans]